MIKKYLGGHGLKWVSPVWSRDSKIDCISRMSWWNELIFCMLMQIQKSEKLFKRFLVGVVKNGHGHLVHETQ